ncbi:hypothetical protein [Ruegeria atlantica]|uniref:hypothetical protein n=1 Tax=Ruegeria atlantica TaxID=81569 RepID=UPI0024959F7A|nr:hypothetical protein [Ruegeria atlantica]
MNKAYIGITLSSSFPSSDDFTLDQDGASKYSLVEVGEAIVRRQPVYVDSLPTVLKYRAPVLLDPLPRIFPLMSLLVVSRDIADVISQFDLGEGCIWPLTYEGPGECSYSAIYVGEKKQTWRKDISPAKMFRFGRSVIDGLAHKSGKGSVILSSAALEGADIWVEPFIEQGVVFISSQLASALSGISLEVEFPLLECQIDD